MCEYLLCERKTRKQLAFHPHTHKTRHAKRCNTLKMMIWIFSQTIKQHQCQRRKFMNIVSCCLEKNKSHCSHCLVYEMSSQSPRLVSAKPQKSLHLQLRVSSLLEIGSTFVYNSLDVILKFNRQSNESRK